MKYLKNELFFGELNEISLEIFYTEFVKKGDYVIDCGANVGRHTFQLSELVEESGKVAAIEPIPSLANNLRGRDNIEVFEVALGAEEKSETFKYVPELPGWSGLKERTDLSSSYVVDDITVAVRKLDTLLKDRTGHIKFIKMDLEGGEFDAMRGAKNLLLLDRPVVVFENSLNYSAKLYGYSEEDFNSFFKLIDYELLDFFGNPIGTFDFDANQPQPWQFVAFPREISTKIMQNLVKDACKKAVKQLRVRRFKPK
jgi:FkbM family methyltransferase